jgi:hypothetical protein
MVVEVRELKAEAEEAIEAEKTTAINRPTTPAGR